MKHIPMVSLRLVRERTVPYQTRSLENSHAVYEMFRLLAEDLDREAICVACLDAKNRVNCLSQVSLGTLTNAPAHPREIMKIALAANAWGIVLVHNHPSGDPEPSREDRQVTAQVKAASQILGIKMLDHLIVGDGRFYSFADQGGL